jgi:hypothetical protein
MKPVFADEQIAVFDDVLSPEQFRAFWDFCQRETYESVHSRGRERVWRLDDGDPLSGPSYAWPSVSMESLIPPGFDVGKTTLRFYPTGKAIDTVLEAVKAHCPAVVDLIGVEGQAWAGITVRPMIYPQGSGLSWHHDGGLSNGAFIFYAHPEWNAVWGGELFVADVSTRVSNPQREMIHKLENRRENEELLRVGMGRFVMAKPNRLVFVAPGCRHAIAKVTSAAGSNPRVALAGFLPTAAGVMEMAQEYLELGR